MLINLADLSVNQVYKTMIQTIIPRPVAWTLTENETGTYNLAPFSYFNAVGSNPPMISLSIGKRSNGRDKDTARNIRERQHFVVHIASVEMAQLVTDSAAGLPENDSEVERLNLSLTSVEGWKLPRLQQCRIAYYCRLETIIPLGKAPQQSLVIGIVEAVYIDDECVQGGGKNIKVLANKVNPLGRLGGLDYCTFGEIFSIESHLE